LNELLHQVGSKPEYQDLVRDLLKFWDVLRGHLEDLRKKAPLKSGHFQIALQDAREFTAEFTGKEDLNKFTNMFEDTYNSVVEDEEVNNWFSRMRIFLESTLKRPEAVTEEDRKEEAKFLILKGKEIFKREDFSKLIDQFQVLLHNLRTDSTTQDFSAKLEKFGRDLLFNEKGLPDLFQLEDSIYQLKNLIVPLFKKTLANIPIKRVEVVTDTYDIRVDDILFDATTFMPEHLDFQLLNASHLDLKNEKKDAALHQMLLHVDNIKPVFNHLKFYYKRKSFPKIQDFGIADLALTGEGAEISVLWTIESRGNAPPFAYLSHIKCEIDKLHIRIIGEATKHELLDTIMAPLISSLIKNKIANIVEDYLKSKLGEANNNLNEWFASRPTYQLKAKADEVIKESYKNIQQRQQQESVQAK